MDKTPYQILQITPQADQAAIKAAYDRLAETYRPDVDSSYEAAERWKEIQWAYNTLRNPLARAMYDGQFSIEEIGGEIQIQKFLKPLREGLANIPARTLTWLLVVGICAAVMFAGNMVSFFQRGWYTQLEEALTTVVSYEDVLTNQSTATQTADPQRTAQALFNLASGWPLVYGDNFTSAEGTGWELGEEDGTYASAIWSISGGKYRWETVSKEGFFWFNTLEGTPVGDFYCQVEAQSITSQESENYGLILRYADDDNYYYFEVQPQNQRYSFYVLHNGQWSAVIDYTSSASIRTSGVNTLTAAAEGDHFTFFINGQYVDEAYDDRIPTGEVGLVVGAYDAGITSVFEFDNFELRTPEPLDIPEQTAIPPSPLPPLP